MAAARRAVALLGLGLLSGLSACTGARALVASSSDYEDYRGVRLAAHEGTRLARAATYLARHPRGVYAAEVRALYEAEEPVYFERAKATPEGARDYLASLPRGPHASAASAVLREDYERKDDIALDRELREGRAAEARFQRALSARRAVGAAVLDAVAALLDPALLGSRREAPPASLMAAVYGAEPSLSGLPAEVERDLFFTLPPARGAPVERPDRVLTLQFARSEREGRVVAASVSGPDLFVHWREADTSEALDPTLAADRALGLAHARERLAGAIEARFPAASCATATPSAGAASQDETVLFARACGGARIDITAGVRTGVPDRIRVRNEVPR